MKIGVISDTHDRLPTLVQALAIFLEEKVDYICHCGDWTKAFTLETVADFAAEHDIVLTGVFGNRDDHAKLAQAPSVVNRRMRVSNDYELLEFALDGRSVVVYHGHHKPTLRRLIRDAQFDVLFTGHTHKPRIDKLEQQKLVVNPGSAAFSIPRRKEPRSVAIYDSRKHGAQLFYFEP